MWPFTTISPGVAVEQELRARLLEKGVTREKLRSILETDQRVALQAVRTERAADSRERTMKNTLRIKTAEERLDKAVAAGVFVYKYCKLCGKHYERCKCENPEYAIKGLAGDRPENN